MPSRPLYYLLIIFFLVPVMSHAALKVDITQGNMRPFPIAIAPIITTEPHLQEAATNIQTVIGKDLERSGLFHLIHPNAFIDKIDHFNKAPHFSSWRSINATALVTAHIRPIAGNQIEVKFRLWDNFAKQQIAGSSYKAPLKNWRRIAHIIADAIYARLTGEEGYFDTRVVYVAETGSGLNRQKRLAIMDQDGANHQFLTSGQHLVLTPRFSPKMHQILYLSYEGKSPRVYLRDIESGRERVIGKFAGMSFAPRFSPDGKKALLSASNNGNSDIYILNLKNNKQKRLTTHPAIDTSPSFAPDQKRIVFNSDRGGSQQLYVMDKNGHNIHRISFGDGRYGSPVWSPRGDLIAFTKMHKGQFYIGVMRPDGSGERLLTQSYLDESPTWSPNGRVIMFTRQTKATRHRAGRSTLHSIDLTGYNERVIPTPIDGSDPAWSPLQLR